MLFGRGLFNANAPLGADLNVLVQVTFGLLLLVGVALARTGRYRAHGVCQATALVMTVVMTVGWMIPSFHTIFAPGLVQRGTERSTAVVLAHATLGTVVLLLGLYVVLVAGTNLIPARLRFANYRRWMRSLLALWWAAIALGLTTYWMQWAGGQ